MIQDTAVIQLSLAELWYLHSIATPHHLTTPPDGALARVTLELERAIIRCEDTAFVILDRIGVYGMLGLARRGDSNVDGTPVGVTTVDKLIAARVSLEDGEWPVNTTAPDKTFLGVTVTPGDNTEPAA